MFDAGLRYVVIGLLAMTPVVGFGQVKLFVLGNVQDAGSPHMGCNKECCADLFENPDPSRMVVSLGVFDEANDKTFMFDATPDAPRQMKYLKNFAGRDVRETPDGIFITHAHIGHYTGLMYLGRESMGATEVPVYAMPKLKRFFETNGPWSMLLALDNIHVLEMVDNKTMRITPDLKVTPMLVPHRDEYSETVGYKIEGPRHSALFIPDIDKWQKWGRNIREEIRSVDYAFIDGSFYDENEIGYRDINEIPHPFVIESMELFDNMTQEDKGRVWFIHLNHTNPLLDPQSKQTKAVLSKGYNIARPFMEFDL